VFLERIAGLSAREVSVALLGFGAAGVAGSWIAGRLVDRDPLGATAGVAFMLCAVMSGIALLGGRGSLALYGVGALWGVAHAAAFVFNQVRVMTAGSQAPAFAASLNIALCNVGIAAGSAAGAWTAVRYGVEATMVSGAALAALGTGGRFC
jgi:predicted MFS family arabinose efflux permease